MRPSLELLLGLLERDEPPQLAAEDFEGTHSETLRAWQEAGFLAREPGVHPHPSCPHCGEGVPYALGGRHVCGVCRSVVAPCHLLLWALDREALLSWLATQLRLRGGLRRIDERLWQLGTW